MTREEENSNYFCLISSYCFEFYSFSFLREWSFLICLRDIAILLINYSFLVLLNHTLDHELGLL